MIINVFDDTMFYCFIYNLKWNSVLKFNPHLTVFMPFLCSSKYGAQRGGVINRCFIVMLIFALDIGLLLLKLLYFLTSFYDLFDIEFITIWPSD